MGIDLQWITESGEVLERVLDPQNTLSKIVDAAPNVEETICLRFIDPYGDTIFNRAQMEVLREELLSVPESALDTEASEHKKKIVELTTKAEAKVHTYLKFYGD